MSAPAQPPSKGPAATPKLSSDVELSEIAGTDAPDTSKDIMHIARIGDVPAMEALFEDADFDATYTDAEGITPLHVGLSLSLSLSLYIYLSISLSSLSIY